MKEIDVNAITPTIIPWLKIFIYRTYSNERLSSSFYSEKKKEKTSVKVIFKNESLFPLKQFISYFKIVIKKYIIPLDQIEFKLEEFLTKYLSVTNKKDKLEYYNKKMADIQLNASHFYY